MRSATACQRSKLFLLAMNTGAPQGCVLSPVLFYIYTNRIMSKNANLTLVKFADDMALIARLRDECSLAQYCLYNDTLLYWVDDSFLELNVQKTKELCIEGGRARDASLVKPVESVSLARSLVSNSVFYGT